MLVAGDSKDTEDDVQPQFQPADPAAPAMPRSLTRRTSSTQRSELPLNLMVRYM